MLILPLLAYVPPFPPASARTVEPGRDLYPAAALAAGVEGDVPVTLHVDPTGALSCTAHGPATLALLKRASCQLIADRDVFLPRIAKDGTVGDNTFELTVRWRLTADESQFGGAVPIGRGWWVRHFDEPADQVHMVASGRVRVSFDLTETGRIEQCKVDQSSYSLALDAAVCPLLLRRATLLPALDTDGRPRRTRGWFWTWWLPGALTEDSSVDAGIDGKTHP